MITTELGLERRPKSGTKYALVFNAVQAGVPRRDLSANTGLPRSDISIVIRNLRNDGYLPKPTPEEKKAALREGAELFRGGLISTAIKPYVEMGMAPREIKLALGMINPENKFSVKQIADALGKGRKKGYFPKLTQEEIEDIQADTHVSDDELKERVKAWCVARELIKKDCYFRFPRGRIEWRKVVARYQ